MGVKKNFLRLLIYGTITKLSGKRLILKKKSNKLDKYIIVK